MMKPAAALLVLVSSMPAARADDADRLPRADGPPSSGERQLPRKMHSAMEVLPRVSVGVAGADISGSDQRALQAAVDYIAGLGGGVVEIGAGEFTMRDSLHLRSQDLRLPQRSPICPSSPTAESARC